MGIGLWNGVVGGPTALVLSGGAAQGDFEVGVVRYLSERGYAPKLIASTSVGSVNAVKLVEGGNIDPSGLEQLWLNKMTSNSAMYIENSDFTAIKTAVSSAMGGGQTIGDDLYYTLLGAGIGTVILAPVSLPMAALIGATKTGVDAGKLFNALTSAMPQLEKVQSLYVLDPLIALLNDPNNLNPLDVGKSPLKLLMATVSLESGELCYVDNSGSVFRSDAVTPYTQYSQVINSKCQPLADQVDQLVQALQNLEEPSAGNNNAAARKIVLSQLAQAERQLKACRAANPDAGDQPLTGVSIIDAVVASASIPMIFKPVQLGSEWFVDGGAASTVPIRAALEKGMTNIWAVLTYNNQLSRRFVVPLTGEVLSSFGGANVVAIAARAAMEILPSAIAEDDIDPEGGWGAAAVTIVEPQAGSDIHNGLTVDPGLIRIRMMHGYMRADDVNNARWLADELGLGSGEYLSLADKVSDALHTTAIVQKRYQIWDAEYDLFGVFRNVANDGTVNPPSASPVGGNPSVMPTIRTLKQELEQLVTSRRSGWNLGDGSSITVDGRPELVGAVPEQPEPSSNWWLQWEKHQFPTPGTPWDGTAFSTLQRVTAIPEIRFSHSGSGTGPGGKTVNFDTWPSVQVDFFCMTPDASIHYTLDGITAPTPASPMYSGAVQVTVPANGVITVRAIAIANAPFVQSPESSKIIGPLETS